MYMYVGLYVCRFMHVSKFVGFYVFMFVGLYVCRFVCIY